MKILPGPDHHHLNLALGEVLLLRGGGWLNHHNVLHTTQVYGIFGMFNFFLLNSRNESFI